MSGQLLSPAGASGVSTVGQSASSVAGNVPKVPLSDAAIYLTWQAVKRRSLDQSLLNLVEPSYRAMLVMYAQAEKGQRQAYLNLLNSMLTPEDKHKILSGRVERPTTSLLSPSTEIPEQTRIAIVQAEAAVKDNASHSSRSTAKWFYDFTDDIETLRDPEWLVKVRGVPVIPRESVCFLYGESGIGKSVLAQDLAHTVGQYETVVYMAGESLYGFKGRCLAWKKHYNLDQGKVFFPSQYCASEVPLLDAEAEADFIESLKRFRPSMVIIDTFSWVLSGGSENNQDDINEVIRASRRIVKATGAAVLFVHHSNNDGKLRGSTAIKAGADVVLRFEERDGLLALSGEKARYADKLQYVCFGMVSVDVGMDEDGTSITAPLILPMDKAQTYPGASIKLTRNRLTVLEYLGLQVVGEQGGLTPEEIQKSTGVPHSTLHHVLNWLRTQDKPLIEQKRGKRYAITDAGRETLKSAQNKTAALLESKRGMVQSNDAVWQIVPPKSPTLEMQVTSVVVSDSNSSIGVQSTKLDSRIQHAVQESNLTGASYRSPVVGSTASGLTDSCETVPGKSDDGVSSIPESKVGFTGNLGSNTGNSNASDLNWQVGSTGTENPVSNLTDPYSTSILGIVDDMPEPMVDLEIDRFASLADVVFSTAADGESLVDMWVIMDQDERERFEARLAQSGYLLIRLSEVLKVRGLSASVEQIS